jgi:hypothetical protein
VGRKERDTPEEEEGRIEMEIMFVLIAVVLFALASVAWGEDSRYGVTDPEWDRRRAWRGFKRR